VIYDEQLRSRFEWLRDPDPAAVATPPLFMAFDLLYCDRRDLTARPLRDRRARLEDVVAGNELIFATFSRVPASPIAAGRSTTPSWRRPRQSPAA
jgi:ATP-dependent DNA ligase